MKIIFPTPYEMFSFLEYYLRKELSLIDEKSSEGIKRIARGDFYGNPCL